MLAIGITDAALGIQISPALDSPFDLSVHDYTVDCTTSPLAQLAIAAPGAVGFEFLGTSGAPVSVLQNVQVNLRWSIALQPGQGFRFNIAGQGPYSIRCLPPDFPPLIVERSGTPQAQWYLFSPNIGPALSYYTIITDSRGTPVWWVRATDSAPDAKVLGPNQISWAHLITPANSSSGSSSAGSESEGGTREIRTFDGRLLNTLTGNIDLHDLQPTPSGTYLTFSYVERVCPPDCADLSAWGGQSQQSVTDAVIIELDQNSNVVWSWRTRDHIALSETGDSGWEPFVGADIIHMNAIEPDGADALMFSARHLNAVYHITKSTGAIDWKLGGTSRPESLTVVGDPRPTATGLNVLSGQHDIRMWPDGTISVHDNGTLVNRAPTVVRYRLDLTNRTAEVVQQVQDVRATGSPCCGSVRLLPGGNWVVQWGGLPYMTELNPNGNPVITIQYNMGSAFSYRAIPVPSGLVAADTLREGMDTMNRQRARPSVSD